MEQKYCFINPGGVFPHFVTYPESPIPVRFDTVEEAMAWATALGKTVTLVRCTEIAHVVATMGIDILPDDANRSAWFLDQDAGVMRLRADWNESVTNDER